MDKPNADFQMSIKSIEEKLNTKPLPIQIPIIEKNKFIGVVDLVNMRKLTWNNKTSFDDNGKSFEIKLLNKDDKIYSEALKNRIHLIESLAQLNEDFAELLLDKYMLDYENMNDHILIETYLRKSCLNCSITPVLIGSSYRNIAVQPLMDSIIKYLPHPSDLSKNKYKKYYDQNFMGLCFKIVHDHQKSRKKIDTNTSTASLNTHATSIINKNKTDDLNDDILTYVRVYNGNLDAKTKVYNVNQKVREFCDKIYIPYANQIKQVSRVTCGNIALVSGFTKVFTFFFVFLYDYKFLKKFFFRLKLVT
jgi:elongation factor G